ncbi:hypothetical protein ACH5RR_007541 [Cinchona calisaya]|uniref:Uncharacterized protein n=1 Tax=Cinchona calisaya TaxID=153742 RepID=A0ABD3AS81_9GENT
MAKGTTTDGVAQPEVEEDEIAKGTTTNGMSGMTDADGAAWATLFSFVLKSHGSEEKGEDDIEMMPFANYLERTLTFATKTPWLKLFNELTRNKIAQDIHEAVYQIVTDWINEQSDEKLGNVVLWALDNILADLASGGSGSQVNMFVLISIILKEKPDILISLLPTLRDESIYCGQNKIPMIVWMIIQASQGDLPVGLYIWAREILPMMGVKSNPSPQTRDLILELVESILSAPNAEQILIAGAVRKGERLIPPSAFDLLLHLTFPVAPVKETARFLAIFPALQLIATADEPESNKQNQLAIQIQDYALRAIGEGNARLSERATQLFIWSLSVNPECYKRWDEIYEDNMESSVTILAKLEKQWPKPDDYHYLYETLNIFREKNEKLASSRDVARRAIVMEADKLCKELLRMLSRGWEKVARLPSIEEIRTVLDHSLRGMLSIFSQKHEGYPSGSMVDFASDANGSPILPVSRLAVHTKDLLSNSKCSLLVAKDPRDRAEVAENDKEAICTAYLARHPHAFWVDFCDFQFMRIEPKVIRCVATAALGSGCLYIIQLLKSMHIMLNLFLALFPSPPLDVTAAILFLLLSAGYSS